MNFLRIRIIDRRCVKSIITQLQAINTSAFNFKEIVIPMRIERGPTDILEALDSTVSSEMKITEYKFMDDPILTPKTAIQKRNFILSRESGKRAARWIIQKHGDIIKNELSEPLIKAFIPPKIYTDKSEVSNEILLSLIEEGSFTEAIHVYKLLEGNVPLETKQALLEIYCYFNSEVRDFTEEYPEEQKYQSTVVCKSNQWIDDNEVNELFQELIKHEQTAAAAYNTMICGYGKYLAIKKAADLYAECINNNIPISSKTYCTMIKMGYALKNNFEECSLLIEKYLKSMSDSEIAFDREVLHSILQCLSLSNFFDQIDTIGDYVVALMKKFISMGVQPCLATYYYLLLIYYPKQNFKTGVLKADTLQNIICDVAEADFTIEDINDEEFFPYAMSIIQQNYFNVSIAHQLQKASEKNKMFFFKPANKSKFYQSYLTIVLNMSSFDEFMEIYDQCIPYAIIPDATLFINILNNFRTSKNSLELFKHLCKFLTQEVEFGLITSNKLLKITCKTVEKFLNPNYLEQRPELKEELTKFVWKSWIHITNVRRRVKYNFSLSGDTVKILLDILIECDQFQKFNTILSEIVKTDVITDDLEMSMLYKLLDKNIARNQVDAVILLLEYCCKHYKDNDVNAFIERIKSNLTITEKDQARIDYILKTNERNKAKSKKYKKASVIAEDEEDSIETDDIELMNEKSETEIKNVKKDSSTT